MVSFRIGTPILGIEARDGKRGSMPLHSFCLKMMADHFSKPPTKE